MTEPPRTRHVGRGSDLTPPNRFESVHAETDYEHLAADDELLATERKEPTIFLPDNAATLIRENDSPDVGFRFSINPYRGCEHGCAYCYARPGHETLGMNAGLDFETKILVKHDAVKLLRQELNHPKWQPEMLMISGVTDCYQPAERKFRLTRGILQVLLEARQPCGIITKNTLILRDLDLLGDMAQLNLVHVAISLTSLDQELTRTLEPRTSSPQARLKAIRELSARGIPVRVMTAPLIPGITDEELPQLLAAAKEAGAQSAGYVMLRLPYAVAPIFQAWLATHRPLAAAKVEGLLRDMRGGKLYKAQWGSRMKGDGSYADLIARTFQLHCRRLGLDEPLPPLATSLFRPPAVSGQRLLF
jgi:DNA repair photolyase